MGTGSTDPGVVLASAGRPPSAHRPASLASPPPMPESDPVPESGSPADDTTLGGYFSVHDRPPGYDGPDGHPYTVSLEVEKTANLRAPYAGYLVFPRWAETGVGIIGHVETPTLVECATSQEAMSRLGEKTLLEVQQLLAQAVERHRLETDD